MKSYNLDDLFSLEFVPQSPEERVQITFEIDEFLYKEILAYSRFIGPQKFIESTLRTKMDEINERQRNRNRRKLPDFLYR